MKLPPLIAVRFFEATARHRSVREAARDVAQSAWLEIARGLGALRDPQAFPTWAYRITSRQAAGHIRRRQADRRLASDLERASLIVASPVEADDGASGTLQRARTSSAMALR